MRLPCASRRPDHPTGLAVLAEVRSPRRGGSTAAIGHRPCRCRFRRCRSGRVRARARGGTHEIVVDIDAVRGEASQQGGISFGGTSRFNASRRTARSRGCRSDRARVEDEARVADRQRAETTDGGRGEFDMASDRRVARTDRRVTTSTEARREPGRRPASHGGSRVFRGPQPRGRARAETRVPSAIADARRRMARQGRERITAIRSAASACPARTHVSSLSFTSTASHGPEEHRAGLVEVEGEQHDPGRDRRDRPGRALRGVDLEHRAGEDAGGRRVARAADLRQRRPAKLRGGSGKRTSPTEGRAIPRSSRGSARSPSGPARRT